MPPVVLGLDTSGPWCSAALVRGDDVFVRRADVGAAHSTHLLPMIDSLLREADLGLDECDAIAFGAGPGSFTGLRVACAVAQGLAYGASRPVAAIGTLDALASSALSLPVDDAVDDAPGKPMRTVLVAQDARMGEIYWSVVRWRAGRFDAVVPPVLSRPAELREALRALSLDAPIPIGVGNAWTVHGALLDGLVDRVVHRDAADAVHVARLGRAAVRDGRTVPAEQAAPLYVRNDVAQTTVQRAATAAARARSAVVV